MCGLYGIVSSKSNGFTIKELDLLDQMMIVSSLRGAHSTGLFSLPADKWKESPFIHKNIGDPFYFINNEELHEPIKKMLYKNGNAVFGHGRSATAGGISIKNAHPFRYKHITLIHNGTLFGESSRGITEKDDVPETDSHHLCINIAENGYKTALSDTMGAFALIWHDALDECVYIARNNQRPLYQYDSITTRFIMSEAEALQFLMKRNDLLVPSVEITQYKQDTVYKITPKNKLEIVYDLEKIKQNKYKWKPQTKETFTHETTQLHDFVVKGFSQLQNKQVKYFATDTKENIVVFYTDKVKDNLIGKRGTCQRVSSICYNDQIEYLVKYKLIQWDDINQDHIQNTSEEQNPKKKKLLISFNNKALTEDQWKNLIKNKTCISCREAINQEDCYITSIDEKQNLLCFKCIDELQHQGMNIQTIPYLS